MFPASVAVSPDTRAAADADAPDATTTGRFATTSLFSVAKQKDGEHHDRGDAHAEADHHEFVYLSFFDAFNRNYICIILFRVVLRKCALQSASSDLSFLFSSSLPQLLTLLHLSVSEMQYPVFLQTKP